MKPEDPCTKAKTEKFKAEPGSKVELTRRVVPRNGMAPARMKEPSKSQKFLRGPSPGIRALVCAFSPALKKTHRGRNLDNAPREPVLKSVVL